MASYGKIMCCVGCVVVLMASACSGNREGKPADEGGVNAVLPDEENRVTVQVLELKDFEHELVSNGKLEARQRADLKFATQGVVAAIYVKNGQPVRKGQKLAELDKFTLTRKTAQARDAMEQARLSMQDVLIGQGYAADDSAGVPADVMRLARVKSGYDRSIADYELARRDEENATLVAPFDGMVANLFGKPFCEPDASEPFCTVVSTRGMEVDFTVLENELPLLRVGDRVEVSPYADATATYAGWVAEINPLVDEKGMVRVKAVVDGRGGGRLFSGMNVRVSVRRSVGRQLVIPKTAIVLRSGKQVVFTLVDGKAFWNYVQTGLENSDSYVVSGETLKEGDTVIVTGNVNLAHESPVQVMENEANH